MEQLIIHLDIKEERTMERREERNGFFCHYWKYPDGSEKVINYFKCHNAYPPR